LGCWEVSWFQATWSDADRGSAEVNYRHDRYGNTWAGVGRWRRRRGLLGGGHDEWLARQRLKSVISGWLRMISFRSTFTALAAWSRRVAHRSFAGQNFPEHLRIHFQRDRRTAFQRDQLAAPTSVPSKITVVPVTATVTALLLMEPPPESFGTRNRIEPVSTVAVRPDLVKLKTVFAPRRVIVRSGRSAQNANRRPCAPRYPRKLCHSKPPRARSYRLASA